METLKQMLFQLLAQTLSMKEFEGWLYNDDYIKNHLLESEMIFELLSIDLKSKQGMYEIEKFCFNHFNEEECLVQIVKFNCELLLETKTDAAAEYFIRNICYFHDWDDDYSLISDIYYLADDWDLVTDGYINKQHFKNELFSFAEIFLDKLKGSNLEESILLLRKGIENRIIIPAESSLELMDPKNKRWFQFWK